MSIEKEGNPPSDRAEISTEVISLLAARTLPYVQSATSREVTSTAPKITTATTTPTSVNNNTGNNCPKLCYHVFFIFVIKRSTQLQYSIYASLCISEVCAFYDGIVEGNYTLLATANSEQECAAMMKNKTLLATSVAWSKTHGLCLAQYGNAIMSNHRMRYCLFQGILF